MAEELIEQERERLSLYDSSYRYQAQLDTFVVKGLECKCLGLKHNDYRATITWNFDWTKLEIEDVDMLSGSIQVNQDNYSETINVELNEKVQVVSRELDLFDTKLFSYKVTLLAVRLNRDVIYEELFLPSSKHDAILIVEEKKLHVNKAFLSYHSEHFEALFSSNTKKGKKTEIPIENVSFNDFGRLISMIYPKSTFPTDRNVEKLLEMADRFMFPGVISRVEYHLLHNSRIVLAKMILMADKYRMEFLLEKCINQLTSTAAVRNLKTSREYRKLSRETKAKILDRIIF